jgi:DNA (cytosine-5)-methyltransferase 1
MKYASVCSGIEAATVAWKPLGWQAQWLSEIEEFPSSVLAHHYPDTPNLGDMTKLKGNKIYEQSTFNVLVGGTPCQAFSIAGLRGGLSDQRSNLALEYCRILIDKQPKWFVWENVPGVFSSFSDEEGSDIARGNGRERGSGDDITQSSDFATLLTAFRECGYSCAWRVFDSRYFGVPQRRRRVFVVGHLGNDWRPSYAAMFERESLRRDFTPSGSKRKRATKGTEGSTGVGNKQWPADTASTLNTAFGDKMGLENQHINEGAPLFVPYTPASFGIQANIIDRSDKSGGNGLGVKEEEAPTLTKADRHCVMQPIIIDAQGGSVMSVYENGQTGTLRTQTHGREPIVTYIVKNDITPKFSDDCFPTLQKRDYKNPTIVANRAMVRRLTPLECERLQGFPDGFTNIPGATDAKRYAAIGNSMTVQVMAWIGGRIDRVHKLMEKIHKDASI